MVQINKTFHARSCWILKSHLPINRLIRIAMYPYQEIHN
jgi:hypothetical protein